MIRVSKLVPKISTVALALLTLIASVSLPSPKPVEAQQNPVWREVGNTLTGRFSDAGQTYTPPFEFEGNLYVATGREISGNPYTEIWRSSTGNDGDWTRIVQNGLTGLGANNANTGYVMAFSKFGNKLYLTNDIYYTNNNICQISGGVVQNNSCRMVWSYDGTDWSQAAPNNFQGISVSPTRAKTAVLHGGGQMAVLDNKLFVGTAIGTLVQGTCRRGEIFSTDNGTDWVTAYNTIAPATDSGVGDLATCSISGMATHRGELYVSTRKSPNVSQIWRTDNGRDWELIADQTFFDGGRVDYLAALVTGFGSELFAAVNYDSAPPRIYRTTGVPASSPNQNQNDWSLVTSDQNISGNGNLKITSVDIDENEIFIGTRSNFGAQIWRAGPGGGPDWGHLTQGSIGFGNTNNIQTGGVTKFGGYFYATAVNLVSRGVQVWRTSITPPPAAQCALDVMIILDLSGSMNFPFKNTTRTKLSVAKRALLGDRYDGPFENIQAGEKPGLLDLIYLNNNGSRVGLVTYRTSDTEQLIPQVYSQFMSFGNIGQHFVDLRATGMLNRVINIIGDPNNANSGLRAGGATPMPRGIAKATEAITSTRTEPNHKTPVVVVIGDGVPTQDIENRNYQDADVEPIVVRIDPVPPVTQSAFRSVADVRNSGLSYPGGVRAGEPLAQTMQRTLDLVGQVPSLGEGRGINSIAMQSEESFNKGMLEYIGFQGGGLYNPWNTSSPENPDVLNNQLNELIQFEACFSRLTVDLPPKLALTPRELYFGGNTYNFNPANLTFNCVSSTIGNCNRYEVRAAIDRDAHDPGAETRDDFYKVVIRDFKKGLGPDSGQSPGGLYGLKLTFQPSIPNAAITDLLNYVNNGTNNKPHVFVGNDTCEAGAGGGYLCLKTSTSLYIPNSPPIPERQLPLIQRISRRGITIEGNTSAPGTSRNYTISPDAIAVGGNVTVTNGTEVDNYLGGQRSFQWDQVRDQLTVLHAKGMTVGTTVAPGRFSNDSYQSNIWRLNSATDDPTATAISSFAAPPEGKIWRRGGNLTLNQPTQFFGSGTVVVNGNLTINRPITCSNTRLAFLVSGSININTNAIGCGSYTALGGNIVFGNATSGDVTGIFVARGNIDLPDLGVLTANYSIRYDQFLATNPTALIKELLEIITTATS